MVALPHPHLNLLPEHEDSGNHSVGGGTGGVALHGDGILVAIHSTVNAQISGDIMELTARAAMVVHGAAMLMVRLHKKIHAPPSPVAAAALLAAESPRRTHRPSFPSLESRTRHCNTTNSPRAIVTAATVFIPAALTAGSGAVAPLFLRKREGRRRKWNEMDEKRDVSGTVPIL
uniref:VAN3-binding protein-like auxin canalisation domain-containing protein n=1 Tax=Oryza rufipogon TaxID=4529 RepID=A0A0E0PVS3_ORYRU